MPIGIFARKIGMIQLFNTEGKLEPVTVLKPYRCQVTQIKTRSKDGYNAIQVAYLKKERHKVKRSIIGLNRPLLGSNETLKVRDKDFDLDFYTRFGEFRVDDTKSYSIEQYIDIDIFAVGQKVKVTGKSIGKGFSGNQKRHNFNRGPMTHGSKNHRLPGSIGAGTTPSRVFPGKKMAGRFGNRTVTIRNCKVIYIDLEKRLFGLKGSVPGPKGNLLKVQ
jgi:large subunit ribosomal protein L3